MAWDDAPPTTDELSQSWDAIPPSHDELKSIGISKKAEAAQAALEHFGDAVVLGHLPHAQASSELSTDQLFSNPADPNDPATVDAKLKAAGFQIKGSDFTTNRDKNIARLAQEKADYPNASLAGTIAGSIAGGVALSPLTPINAATIPGRVLQAGRAGLAVGALTNPGDVAGEVNPLQLGARAKNAALDAAVGIPVQLGVEGTSALLGVATKGLQNRAAVRAANAVGIDKSAAKSLLNKYGPDAVKELGQSALDEGLITPFATPAKISESAQAIRDSVGKDIGNLLDTADAAGASKISAKDIALTLSADPEIAALKTTPGLEGVSDKLDRTLNTLYSNGDELSLREAQTLRRGIDKSINHSKSAEDMKGLQPYLYEMRDALAKGMNSSINDFQGNESDALRAINRRYSDLSRIEEIATKRTAGNVANRAIGLTDTIAGAGGAGAGSVVGTAVAGPAGAKIGAFAGGAIGGGLNKLARTYGPALDANASQALSRLSDQFKIPVDVLQKNPAIIPILVNASMDKGDKKPDNPVSRRLLTISQQ